MRPFVRDLPRLLRRHLLCAVLMCPLVGHVQAVFAGSYPDQPIHMLVGFSAGGTTDLLARLVAQQLSEQLGQPVLVENRTGAGGNIAAAIAAHAAPDGYTIIMGAINHAINATLYHNLNYVQVRDLAPVSMVAVTPNVLVVPADSPFHSVKELIDYGRRNPGKLTFASSGVGTSVHLSGELFKSLAGIDMVHVPYQGVAPAEMDLVGGRVSMMFDSIFTALPLINSGKLRVLAVTSARRSGVLPDTPTIAESGLAGFDVSPWYCIFVPIKTPRAIIDTLNRAVVTVMAKPDVRSRLAKLGTDPFADSPQEADRYVRAEIGKWATIIRASHAQAN